MSCLRIHVLVMNSSCNNITYYICEESFEFAVSAVQWQRVYLHERCAGRFYYDVSMYQDQMPGPLNISRLLPMIIPRTKYIPINV